MDVLEKILDLITKNYASDAAFEVAANLPPKTVYDWKRGKSKGYLKILPKLSELFDVPVAHFYGEAVNTDIRNKPAATEDDELLKLLDNPINREIFDKMSKLTPENFDLIRAQIDFLTSRQERPEDK